MKYSYLFLFLVIFGVGCVPQQPVVMPPQPQQQPIVIQPHCEHGVCPVPVQPIIVNPQPQPLIRFYVDPFDHHDHHHHR